MHLSFCSTGAALFFALTVQKKMQDEMEHPAWLLTVKFHSCNNLLSSVHTDCIILRLCCLIIKGKLLLLVEVVAYSFRLFLQRLFKSSTTQRHSRHSTDTLPEFHAEAPQATELRTCPRSLRGGQSGSRTRPFGRKVSTLPKRHHVPHVWLSV